MQLYIAILPSEEVIIKVQKIRDTFQRGKISEPHITIVPPFTLSGDLKVLEKDIEEVSRTFKPFVTKLTGIALFDKGEESVLYAKVVSQGVMAEIQRKISEKMTDKARGIKKNFTQEFHLTVLKRMPYRELEKINNKIKNKKFNEEFLVDELILFGIEKQAPWKIIKRFKFKNE